ncbi:hypothetical protein J6S55_02080 [Candidatus Saccharibacteria bacterium]|nr:hypothetical protein [Candidatus Saccharibacteria bacterium]
MKKICGLTGAILVFCAVVTVWSTYVDAADLSSRRGFYVKKDGEILPIESLSYNKMDKEPMCISKKDDEILEYAGIFIALKLYKYPEETGVHKTPEYVLSAKKLNNKFDRSGRCISIDLSSVKSGVYLIGDTPVKIVEDE